MLIESKLKVKDYDNQQLTLYLVSNDK